MNPSLAKQLNDKHYPHQLEAAYPHIVEKIAAHWAAHTLEPYLDGLLFDTRGDRAGFSPEILSEIFSIQNYYRSLQPPKPTSIDTWADSVTYTP